LRLYVRIETAPSSAGLWLRGKAGGSSLVDLTLNTDRTVTFNGQTSAPLELNAYERIEIGNFFNGTNWTIACLLNGALFGTATNATSYSLDTLTCNLPTGVAYRIDDFSVNDDAGSVNNSWCGPSHGVLWLSPVSDAQRGSWTGGAGGTTNLYEKTRTRHQTTRPTNTDQIWRRIHLLASARRMSSR
jgi:hypothetical protein